MLRVAFTLLALHLSLTGCGDPCSDLASKICRCEPNETDQRACEQRAETEGSRRKSSDADKERCADFVDSCSCNKLAQGDLAACGLSKE